MLTVTAATVHIGARIEAELVERFGVLAALRERTFSAELRLAMRNHLAAAELEQRSADAGD